MKLPARMLAVIILFMFMLVPTFARAEDAAVAELEKPKIDLEELEDGIRNVVLLEDGVVAGGPPSERAIKELRRQGFHTVIDLRAPEEGTAEEQAAVKAEGMKYFNIPVTTETLSITQVDAVANLLSNSASKPVVIHCASGNRVGALWALYLRKYRGFTTEAALKLSDEKGLMKPEMREKTEKLLSEF